MLTIVPQTLLGIDYGSEHVGLAIKFNDTMTAVPYSVYERHGEQQATLIAYLSRLVTELSVDTIIIGLPISMSGEETHMAHVVRTFADELSEHSAILVECMDERMTSAISGRGQHDLAATQILQTYIDCHA